MVHFNNFLLISCNNLIHPSCSVCVWVTHSHFSAGDLKHIDFEGLGFKRHSLFKKKRSAYSKIYCAVIFYLEWIDLIPNLVLSETVHWEGWQTTSICFLQTDLYFFYSAPISSWPYLFLFYHPHFSFPDSSYFISLDNIQHSFPYNKNTFL